MYICFHMHYFQTEPTEFNMKDQQSSINKATNVRISTDSHYCRTCIARIQDAQSRMSRSQLLQNQLLYLTQNYVNLMHERRLMLEEVRLLKLENDKLTENLYK